jgi:hypothetical protein
MLVIDKCVFLLESKRTAKLMSSLQQSRNVFSCRAVRMTIDRAFLKQGGSELSVFVSSRF